MGMEDYPKTILEFEQRFSTEEAHKEYLFRLRWPQGLLVPGVAIERSGQ